MEKLIITVTVDSSMQYPLNPYLKDPHDIDFVAEQYIEAVKAGASIAHMHGVHHLENEIQPDGRRMSRIDHEGWKQMKEKIQAEVDPVIQFGIASARMEEKVKLMDLKPDLMSICFTSHDEHFQQDESVEPVEMYSIHPRSELEAYAKAGMEKGVKLEIESFGTGAFYNIKFLADKGMLPEPIWTTLFFWPGGQWTPPTFKSLIWFVDHMPKSLKINWNTSVMDYQDPDTQVRMLTLAIMMGGHVRVGWEDNPYINGRTREYAKTNAELVRKIKKIAEELGRNIATPDEARQIIGIPKN